MPLIRFLASVVTVLAAGACGHGSGQNPFPVLCIADGHHPISNVQCCSGALGPDGLCAAPSGGCLEVNLACLDGAACCSGVCASNGFCSPAGGVACGDVGAGCAIDVECCTFSCGVAGTCAANPAACRNDNSICNADDLCCSNHCTTDGLCGLP